MEFNTHQSTEILGRQRPECRVQIRMDGGRFFDVSPSEAAQIAAKGDWVGVGHHKCIVYLRPRHWGLWLNGKTTERLRNDARFYIGDRRALKHVGERVNSCPPEPTWMRASSARPGEIDLNMMPVSSEDHPVSLPSAKPAPLDLYPKIPY